MTRNTLIQQVKLVYQSRTQMGIAFINFYVRTLKELLHGNYLITLVEYLRGVRVNQRSVNILFLVPCYLSDRVCCRQYV